MANGYIGKISAVVTANTSDLSRKLQGAVKDVDRFAQSLNRSVSASAQQATASLEKIFTPLQRLERRLQTALQLNLRTDDEVRKIQQLVSVAEGINKPLERAAGSFSKLSLEVQGAFLPALNRAQDAAVNLSNTLQQQGSVSANSFKQVEQVVERTTQAIQRLTQAQQLASQSLTGNELQFGNPRLFETLTANAAATRRAAALPAAALEDGSIARQIRALQQYQNAAVEAAARVESLRLEPNVNPEVVLAAERRLESLIETATRARQQVENAVEISQNIGAATQLRSDADPTGRSIQERSRDIAAAAEATERRRQAEAALRSEQEARLAVANSLLQVDQRESQLTSLEGTASTRDASGRSIQERVRDIQNAAEATERRRQAEAALRSEQEARLAVANSLLQVDQRESELITNRGSATNLGGRIAEQGRRRVQRLTGDINIDSSLTLGPSGVDPSGQAQRDIDALASRVGQVRQQLETLPNSVRTQFIPALQQAQQELIGLQNAPDAATDEIENAAIAVQRLEQNANRAQAALNFRTQFGGAGIEGLNRGLDQQAVQGYAAQLQLLQATLGRVSAEAAGPAVAAQNRLRNAIADAMEDGSIRTERGRRVLQQYTAEAVEATAAVAGVSRGALGRQLARAGDIGRAGFDRFTLGLNQAVFAIDDFFSVTGGLEQRIRAVGNNITQLGFVVGGTAGLVTALAAVLAGQGFAAYLRFSEGGRTAEDRAKSLNDALSRQLEIAQQLASALNAVASTLTSGIFSESARDAADFANQIEEVRNRQQELRDSRLGELDPQAAGSRAEQNRIDRELQSEENIGRRAALLIQRRRAEEEERTRIEAARAAPVPTVADTLTGISLSGLSAEIQRELRDGLLAAAGAQDDPRRNLLAQIDATQQASRLLADRATARTAVFQVDEADARDSQAAIARLVEQEARLRDELAAALDQSTIAILRAGQQSARRIEGLQEAASAAIEAGVDGGTSLRAQADSLGRSLAGALRSLEEADEITDPVARAAASEAAERQAATVRDAADALRGQQAAIEAVTGALAAFDRALEAVSSQADQNLRSAESDFAQARADAATAPAGLSRRRAGAALDAAGDDLERQRASREAVAAAVGAARARAATAVGGDPQAASIADRLSEIARILETGIISAADQRRLQQEQGVLRVQLENRQAAFVEQDQGVQAALRRDERVRAEATAAARGRDLLEGPGQRAGRELQQSLADIGAAFDRNIEAILDRVGGRPQDAQAELDQARADRDAAVERARQDAFRAQAPAIFGLADAVQNALLQGPSRAALEATDVSTVQGARELNRLLRGDDAARNQDLVQLQREANRLLQLIADGGAAVAD